MLDSYGAVVVVVLEVVVVVVLEVVVVVEPVVVVRGTVVVVRGTVVVVVGPVVVVCGTVVVVTGVELPSGEMTAKPSTKACRVVGRIGGRARAVDLAQVDPGQRGGLWRVDGTARLLADARGHVQVAIGQPPARLRSQQGVAVLLHPRGQLLGALAEVGADAVVDPLAHGEGRDAPLEHGARRAHRPRDVGQGPDVLPVVDARDDQVGPGQTPWSSIAQTMVSTGKPWTALAG